MYQTLQSTGVCWALHLIIPGVDTVLLSYGNSLKRVLDKLQPNIPLSVKPDAILSKYFRNDGKLTLIKGNMTGKREGWQGKKRR